MKYPEPSKNMDAYAELLTPYLLLYISLYEARFYVI